MIQKPTEAKNFGITLASTVSAGKRLLAVGATGGFTATWMPVNPYVYIYDISNPGNIQLLNRIEGQFATEFGAELHFIGDFNSNGSHELAIGIPAGGPNLIGQVIILDNLDQSYGNVRVSAGGVCSCQSGCNGAPPALVPAILGDEGFSGFGSSISSNPMHRDLIVGAPLDNEVPGSGQLRADQGTVHVFSYLSGSSAFTGALQPVIVIGDSATGSHLGTAVLGVEGSDPNTTAPTGNSIAAVVAGAPSGIYGAAKTYKYYENYPMPGAPGYSMLSYISSNGVANIPVGKSLSYFGDIDQDGTLEFSVNASGLSNPMTSLVNLIEWSPVHWSLNPGNTISTIASACTLGGNSPGAPATLAINTAQINGPIPTARIKGDITTDVGAQVFVVFGTLHASGIPFGPCSFKLNTDIVYGSQTPIHLDANAEAVVNLLPVSLPAGLNLLELGSVALIVNNSGSLKLTETQLVKVGL